MNQFIFLNISYKGKSNEIVITSYIINFDS